MTTKERIVEEAWTLFSENGYKGTSVKNIADAVGIKDSSLYKHFKSKQEIFDTIIQQMKVHIEQMVQEIGFSKESDESSEASVYAEYGEKEILELSKQVFLFYLEDRLVVRFWKMAMIERFHSPEVYQVYHKFYLERSIARLKGLFEEMMKWGAFLETDAEVMAMNFYTPIYFLLCKYIGEPERREEALATLERQVKEFVRIYSKK